MEPRSFLTTLAALFGTQYLQPIIQPQERAFVPEQWSEEAFAILKEYMLRAYQ